jgi:hypothetical protein
MKYQRNNKTDFLIWLRHLGMLCKKPHQPKPRIRISHTVMPPDTMTPIEAEQHVWIESKKRGRVNCQFDSKTRTCPCGIKSVESFALDKCNKK